MAEMRRGEDEDAGRDGASVLSCVWLLYLLFSLGFLYMVIISFYFFPLFYLLPFLFLFHLFFLTFFRVCVIYLSSFPFFPSII